MSYGSKLRKTCRWTNWLFDESSEGEKVLIHAFDIPEEMVVALVRAARDRGAIPFVSLQNARISRELVNQVDLGQFEAQAVWELDRMEKWMRT